MCRVICCNGEPLYLKRLTVLSVLFSTNLVWHEFEIVLNFPFKVLIEADVLALHLFSFQYLNDNKKWMQFGVSVCANCNRFRNDPALGIAA